MFTCCKTQENITILNRGTEDELVIEFTAALHVIKCKSTVTWHFTVTVLFVIVIVNQKKKIVL